LNFIFQKFLHLPALTPPDPYFMAENQDTPQSHPSTATPASNQNLIIGIVMGAVILLLLLLVISQQSGGFNFGKKEDTGLEELRKELDAEKLRRDSAKTAALGLTAGNDANLLAGNIQRDAESLLKYINATQGELARLRGSEAAQQENYVTIGNLKAQLAQAQGAQNQLAGLQAQLQSAQSRIQQLTEQLSGSVDQGVVASLRNQLAGTQKEREDLRMELIQLKADMQDMPSKEELARLRALDPENRRLRAEIQELRAKMDSSKKLFVERENLSPRASALFRELVRLEGENSTGLKQAYRRIQQDMKARVIETATFRTGSSALDPEHETHIENILPASPDGAFFLVVGYASQSGDSQSNRELSRKRSTRTASVVNYLKRQGHKVQAVYLGETNRFGSDNPSNQVCEVWEIKP